MAKFKFLVMASILSLATTVAMGGCGEDEEGCPDLVSCENVDECDNGACTDAGCPDLYETNLCVTGCTADGDCGEDEVCEALCEGGLPVCQPTACITGSGGDGGGGDGGGNGTACQDNEDCFAETAFCASTTDTCFPIDCGDSGNNCDRCGAAPGDGQREANGPVIFGITQDDLAAGAEFCETGAEGCADGYSCQFTFFYMLADGAALPGSLYTAGIRNVGPDGTLGNTQGNAAQGLLDCDTGSQECFFRGCFDTSLDSIGGAVVLIDNQGNSSNALCFTGDVP